MKTYLTYRNSDLFDQALNNFFRPFYMDDQSTYMQTDILENESAYLLEVEMPGFDKNNISLKYEKGYLTISANRDFSTAEVKVIRQERAVSCSRTYYMGEVDEKLITAKYENGVLTVTVPKQKPQDTKHTIVIE